SPARLREARSSWKMQPPEPDAGTYHLGMRVLRCAFALSCSSLVLVSPPSAASLSCSVEVVTLQIDPVDHTVLYAGTISDGLLKRIDFGRSSHPLIDPLVESTSALLFDPTAPSNLYSATYGESLFRSRDGGQTWQRSSHGLVPPPCGPFPCLNTPEF